MTITGFTILDEQGEKIFADPDGNNMAFACLCCGHPVLVARLGMKNSRGYCKEKPTECKRESCGARYFLDTRRDLNTGKKLPWCCPKNSKKEAVHDISRKPYCCADKFFEGKRQDEKIFYIHRLA